MSYFQIAINNEVIHTPVRVCNQLLRVIINNSQRTNPFCIVGAGR